MKRILYTATFLVSAQLVMAQLPEDALRMSWVTPYGTARHQAIGGAMISLGGEITATFANPAGLGMYKTSEFVLSPGFSFLNGKGNFRGTDNTKADKMNRFNFGTSGFVSGHSSPERKWTSRAFSIAVNRTSDFNNTTYYKGVNDYSSFAEPMANEFANSGLTIDQALNSPNISLQTKMALYTYLVDTATINGSTQVIARSEQAGIVNQANKVTSTGGVTEIAFGFGANMDDRLYLGFGIGVPIVNFERTTEWSEEDANGRGNNEFAYSNYYETYTTKGFGVNAKLGMIFKPAEQFRIGLTIHTPSIYSLNDDLSSTMTTDIDTATGSVKVFQAKSSDFSGDGSNPHYEYDFSTPWRFGLGFSYVIHEVEDVTKQRGFITADIEYATYGNTKFKSAEDVGNNNLEYEGVNEAIKAVYRGAFNFKLGGELKFNTIMGRLGFAYYGNPYEDKVLKANRMNFSGGIGYRNKGKFIDLTYVHSLQKNVDFPYRVEPPRQNTYADLKETVGSVILTVGFKF